MNHLAWCVIILNCTRTASVREPEVLSTSKLKDDEKAGLKVVAKAVKSGVQMAPCSVVKKVCRLVV
jgi:hypothetical protein